MNGPIPLTETYVWSHDLLVRGLHDRAQDTAELHPFSHVLVLPVFSASVYCCVSFKASKLRDRLGVAAGKLEGLGTLAFCACHSKRPDPVSSDNLF
jgi:hypothetical protein